MTQPNPDAAAEEALARRPWPPRPLTDAELLEWGPRVIDGNMDAASTRAIARLLLATVEVQRAAVEALARERDGLSERHCITNDYLGEDCPGCRRNRLMHMSDGTLQCEKCGLDVSYERALEKLRSGADEVEALRARLAEAERALERIANDTARNYDKQLPAGEFARGGAHAGKELQAIAAEYFTAARPPAPNANAKEMG